MYRSQMSNKERECRSRLKAYISHQGLLRGSLTMRRHTCGKPNCKCAKGDYRHSSLYLTRVKDGKLEQLYIPKEKQELVRSWVENFHLIQELLERISSTYWGRIKRKD